MTDTRIVTAPVLIPHSPDCEYALGEDTLTNEQIQEFKESFDKSGIFDLNHDYENKIRNGEIPKNRGVLLDSFILDKPTKYTNINNTTETLPKGTLMLKSKITDPETIKLYDQGKIRAYSATVMPKLKGTIMDLIKQSSTKSINIPKTFTRDLRKNIKDPIMYTVSYVDQPCQPETVFCKLCDINNNSSVKEDKKDKDEVYEMTDNKDKINNILSNAMKEVNTLFSKSSTKEDLTENKTEEEIKESKTEEESKTEMKTETNQSDYITEEELDKKLEEKMNKASEDISTRITEALTNQLTEEKASVKENYLTKSEVDTVIEDNFKKFEDTIIAKVTENNKASVKSYKDKLSKDIKGTNEQKVETQKQNQEEVPNILEGRDFMGRRKC